MYNFQPPYTDPERHNAQRHRWTDRQRDNSRSYCMSIGLTKKDAIYFDSHTKAHWERTVKK